MAIVIKVLQHRTHCKFVLPIFSEGKDGAGVLLREEYCRLPWGHAGPHQGAAGGSIIVNQHHNMDLLEQGKL